MPAYRKRRISKSLNKNELRSLRNKPQDERSLQSHFPTVDKITIDLEFLSREGHILLNERREFDADAPFDLVTPCPGRCGDGTMDLKSKVESAVRSGDTNARGR